MERETINSRPAAMELRVIINAYARTSVLSFEKNEAMRMQALNLVDRMERECSGKPAKSCSINCVCSCQSSSL